jgi:hypothetical protein
LPLPWWDADAAAGSLDLVSKALAGGAGAARSNRASKNGVAHAEWIMGEYLIGFWNLD